MRAPPYPRCAAAGFLRSTRGRDASDWGRPAPAVGTGLATCVVPGVTSASPTRRRAGPGACFLLADRLYVTSRPIAVSIPIRSKRLANPHRYIHRGVDLHRPRAGGRILPDVAPPGTIRTGHRGPRNDDTAHSTQVRRGSRTPYVRDRARIRDSDGNGY